MEDAIRLIEQRIGRCQNRWNHLTEEITAEANSAVTHTDDLISMAQRRKEEEVIMRELTEVLDIVKAYASLLEKEDK